jgi:cytochrome c oxidase subunit 1
MSSNGKSWVSVPLLFALAALPAFVVGALSQMPLALNAADLYVHDTYYVITHSQSAVALGTIFAGFAMVYYWFPKVSGRLLNQRLGYAHFWLSLLFTLGVFVPMCVIGSPGIHRRWYDDGGGNWREITRLAIQWNRLTSVSIRGGFDPCEDRTSPPCCKLTN